jgi:multiple sugar transport system ATP-binding protein
MKDGFIQQIDTPLKIYHHPTNKFVAGFIGSPTMNFMNGRIKTDGRLMFQQEISNFSLPVPSELETRLKSYGKPQIILGIRPEHIYARKPGGVDTVSSFKANIEVVEPVGNEIFVYFSTGTDAQYVARLATDTPPAVGRPFELLFDTSKVHFFDKETEKAF